MNKVSLIGRLGKDPDIRYITGQNQMAIARLSLAVDRKFIKGEEKQTDWISCIAFGKTAENIGKYFFKGSRIGITGRIQTSSYKGKDGSTKYSFDVVVEDFDFIDYKSTENRKLPDATNNDMGEFSDISKEDTPF